MAKGITELIADFKELHPCAYKRIRDTAIDEFVEKAYFILGCEDSDIYCKETIKEIAEQLKVGGIDG